MFNASNTQFDHISKKEKTKKKPFPNYKGGNIGKIGMTTSLGIKF